MTWKRHVGKVSATLTLLCPDAKPDELTAILGIQPTHTDLTHHPTTFTPTGLKGARDYALWRYDSASQVSSPDINEHLKHLLTLFLSLKSRIEEMRPRPGVMVSIYWESIVASTAGPQVDRECIAGLAELGASLDIHVVEIDKVDED